jgi:hypothetical protein
MHNPSFAAIMSIAAVAGVASATQAISLANFTPRIENLPSSCSQAYTSTIAGCQASDFSPNVRCSAQCVQGLLQIADVVKRQCSNVDVPETSIIGVFMLGAGVPAVCPGIVVTTIGRSSTQGYYPTSSQAPPEQTTTQAQASSSAASSSAAATDSASSSASTTSSSQESSAASSSAPSSTAAPTTTASQPQITLDTSAMAAPPAATTAASPQKSNQDSGGGSPFDVVASGSSTQLRLGRFASAMLGVAALIAVVQ